MIQKMNNFKEMVSMAQRDLFFVLNGEYPTLASSEVLAILQATENNYSNTKIFDQLMKISASIDSIEAIARRSALVHRCCILLFESVNSVEEILNNARDVMIDSSLISGKSFGVRIKRIKNHSTHIDKTKLEQRLGAVFFNLLKNENSEIKVNLENPDISFYGVLTENKFFFGISIWKSKTYFERFDARRGHKRDFFHPGTLDPRLARVLVNLSRAKVGRLFVDPFAGAGGILIEAGLIGASILGCDVQKTMIKGASVNLKQFNLSGDLICADARLLPLTNDIHAIATDPPYGKSSTTKGMEVGLLIESFFESVANFLQKKRYICICAPIPVDVHTIANNFGFKTVEIHKMRVHKSLSRAIGIFQN
jgi:tRNA (guanine10-N2)-dimethyltransferase